MAIKQLVELDEWRRGNWLVAEVERRRADKPPRVDPGWFHPSALSHPCDAFLAFQFLGVQPRPNAVDAQRQRVFDLGHARDRDWKGYLEETGLSAVGERELPECERCRIKPMVGRHICIPELRIRGELDDFVQDGQRTAVVEFKTKRSELWEPLAAPERDHVIQVHPYMFAKQCLQTQIIYENKNDQRIKEFTIKWDDVVWSWIVTRVQRILNQLSVGESPTRTPSQWEADCAFYTRTSDDFPGCAAAQFPQQVDLYRERQGLA